MTTPPPGRTEALRHTLITIADAAPFIPPKRRHRTAIVGLLVFALSGVVTGGTVSAIALGQSARVETVMDPEILVGTEGIPLGTPVEFSGSGDSTISLGTAHVGATHVAMSFYCDSQGSFTMSLDSPANPIGMSCDTRGGTTGYAFKVEGTGDHSLIISAGADESYEVWASWASKPPIAWSTNENGQSYGSSANGADPDLILAEGLDKDGLRISGYVLSDDPNGPQPSSPEEALAWQEHYQRDFPDGRDIPLYESDGMTQIGTFHVG